MNQLAEDACRMCFIVPKWMRDEMNSEIDAVNQNISAVMRKVIYEHIMAKRRKESRKNGQAK